MATFDRQQESAKKLIAKFGQKVKLVTFTTAIPDLNKPWEPATPTRIEQDVDAVFLKYEQGNIDGQLIQAGDQKVLIPAVDAVTDDPNVQGQIVRGSEIWKIISVGPLNPNGEKIMFTVQVRR